jgi:hypothetical protein
MGVPFNKEGKGPYIVKECLVAVVGGGGLIHFFCGRGMMNGKHSLELTLASKPHHFCCYIHIKR